MNYKDLFSLVRTVAERDALHEELDAVLDNLYRAGHKTLEDVLQLSERREVAQVLKRILVEEDAQKDTKAAQKVLEDIKAGLQGLEVIKLDIAFDPNPETVSLIHAWLIQNLGGHILIQIIIDRALIGGVRIAFRGRYKEVTLATIISLYLESADSEITKMLHVPMPVFEHIT